jgi:ceramide glucosyltransferase
LNITCVVGKSMLMPVKALEAIGGLAASRNLLAEDQAIGVKVRKAGYRIKLSHHVIENVNESRDLKWFLNRHSRWLKIRYQMALPTFLIEPLSNLTTIGLVWALTCGESALAWAGLFTLCGLSMARDAVQTRWLRGSFPKLRDLPLSLVKDLFMLPIWFDSLVNRKIQWRGHKLIVAPRATAPGTPAASARSIPTTSRELPAPRPCPPPIRRPQPTGPTRPVGFLHEGG